MQKYESTIEWAENYNMLKKSIYTSISINGNYLEIKSKENERLTLNERRHKHIRACYSKPFKPFFLGEKTIDIEDIISVRIRNGRIFGFFTIFCYLIYIIGIFAMFYKVYSIQIEKGVKLIGLLPTIVIISYILFMCLDFVECYKYKTLQINIKNEKSISIPIEKWKENDNIILKNLIDDLININSKIKVKESINRNKKIKILFFLYSVVLSYFNKNSDEILVYIGVTLVSSILFLYVNIDFEKIGRKIEKNLIKNIAILGVLLIVATIIPFAPQLINRINYEIKSNKEEEYKQLIIDKKCYTEVNVVRAILKESKRIDNSHFKNTYKIKETGEEIEFEETYFTRFLNKEYNIWIFKYYLNDNKKLITIKYDSFDDEYKQSSVYMYDTEYIYDKENNKIMSFYIPRTTNKGYSPMSFSFYYKIDASKSKDKISLVLDKIYKFLYSSQMDILQQKNEDKYFKLIDTFSSHYGKCYIIKYDNDSNETDYYIYIENNNMKSDNDYDGIFIIYQNSPFTNDNNAISYFKEVINY